MDPVVLLMDPVHILMDPVHGGGVHVLYFPKFMRSTCGESKLIAILNRVNPVLANTPILQFYLPIWGNKSRKYIIALIIARASAKALDSLYARII